MTASIDWSSAQTGISLRDTHLLAWVKQNNLEKLTLSLSSPWPLPVSESNVKSHSLQINLDAANSTLSLPLDLQCESKTESKKQICTFSTPGFSLERMGWKSPCFLGACVRATDRVTGRIEIFE